MSFLEGFTQGGLFGSAKMPGGAEVLCEETTDIEESQFRDLLKPFLASAAKNKIQEAAEERGIRPRYETQGGIILTEVSEYDVDVAISEAAEAGKRAAARTRATAKAILDITQMAPKPLPSDYLEELGLILRKLEKDLNVQICRDGSGRLFVASRRDKSKQRNASDVGIKNPITQTHDK